jgi:hypothetical protein
MMAGFDPAIIFSKNDFCAKKSGFAATLIMLFSA